MACSTYVFGPVSPVECDVSLKCSVNLYKYIMNTGLSGLSYYIRVNLLLSF